MKLFRLATILACALLAGCINNIRNISDSPNTLTGMRFLWKTDKSRPKGYPCYSETSFYLQHGQFLYNTKPISETEDPDMIASHGAYSYSKCGAGCGHISLYDTNGKDTHNIWDIELCYKQIDRGTFVAHDRADPRVWHEGKFTVE